MNKLVPLGLQFIRSNDPYERWAGANLLVSYVATPEARTSLEGALNDSDERVRSTASRALQNAAAHKR